MCPTVIEIYRPKSVSGHSRSPAATSRQDDPRLALIRAQPHATPRKIRSPFPPPHYYGGSLTLRIRVPSSPLPIHPSSFTPTGCTVGPSTAAAGLPLQEGTPDPPFPSAAPPAGATRGDGAAAERDSFGARRGAARGARLDLRCRMAARSAGESEPARGLPRISRRCSSMVRHVAARRVMVSAMPCFSGNSCVWWKACSKVTNRLTIPVCSVAAWTEFLGRCKRAARAFGCSAVMVGKGAVGIGNGCDSIGKMRLILTVGKGE